MIALNVPVSYGLGCSIGLCNEITESNLSESEKDRLIGDVIYTDRKYPNFDFVDEWNGNIEFSTAPTDSISKNSGYIDSAWMKIISISPSMLVKDKLLSPGNGDVSTRYGYNVRLPSENEGSDCKTEFNLKKDDAELKIYLNDWLIGDSLNTNFESFSSILNFHSVLELTSEVEVKHYKEYKWCCRRDRNGGCSRWCTRCRYETTETRTNQLKLEDSKSAFLDNQIVNHEIKAIDSYRETTVGILNISDFTSFELSFEDSFLKQFNYVYSVESSLKPYDVITLKAEPIVSRNSDNMVFEQMDDVFKFYMPNADNCKLKYSTHFSTFEEPCNLNFDFPEIKIETDKLQYDENETIIVNLEPKNQKLNVKYGNNEYDAINSLELKATKDSNRITASFHYRSAERMIHVKNNNSWIMAMNFAVFSSVLFSFYLLAQKYWGFVL